MRAHRVCDILCVPLASHPGVRRERLPTRGMPPSSTARIARPGWGSRAGTAGRDTKNSRSNKLLHHWDLPRAGTVLPPRNSAAAGHIPRHRSRRPPQRRAAPPPTRPGKTVAPLAERSVAACARPAARDRQPRTWWSTTARHSQRCTPPSRRRRPQHLALRSRHSFPGGFLPPADSA
eukprot:COSAG01_NODE_20965_length_925_cov_1.135593_2_plen_176_part_01